MFIGSNKFGFLARGSIMMIWYGAGPRDSICRDDWMCACLFFLCVSVVGQVIGKYLVVVTSDKV